MEGGLRGYTTAIVVGFLVVALGVLGMRWHAIAQRANAEPAKLYSYAPPKRGGSGSVAQGKPQADSSRSKSRGVSPSKPPAKPAPEPAVEKAAKKLSSSKAALPKPHSININSATQAQLELLPGIGPSLASRIIGHRNEHGPFKSVDALDDVKGIGPKKLEDIAPYCYVD